MALVCNFNTAIIEKLTLAKVGSPYKGEALKMSKELCQFGEEDKNVLTYAFLRSFKNLDRYNFSHHSDIELNELYGYIDNIFKKPEDFLNQSRKAARLLYEKSQHPNIKSGDLCMAYIDGIQVNGEMCDAISIVKSESHVPFIQITDREGDLTLVTLSGIYPDKIDKGVFIVNHDKENGYLVYTFDKSGGETNFWVKEFLGVQKKRDAEYKTKQYAEMCNSFLKEGLEDVNEEDRFKIANRAMNYLQEKDVFNAEHFEEQALEDPNVIEQFNTYKSSYHDEEGEKIEEDFEIEPEGAKKVSGKFKPALRLDSGVILRFTPDFIGEDGVIERGVDEETGKNFIKVYYEEEV